MKIEQTIGIDISKLVIDVCMYTNKIHKVFSNSSVGFKELIKWIKFHNTFSMDNTLFALEHTGIYSEQISVFFSNHNLHFVLIPGLEIKKSLGITRGKNDKVDAFKIAQYAYRLRDEIKTTVLPSKRISQVKSLLSLRENLVKKISGLKSRFKEESRLLVKKENKVLLDVQKQTIAYLSKQIKKIEDEINGIIQGCMHLKKQYALITSIQGVGEQTAINIIVTTHGFQRFDTWRKFASYCGTAPFTHTSGTSIRGKTKVSNLANKKIKSLLDLCAKSAIQNNPEMKKYYKRRVEEGKNKMSTINIIRNKLLSRIFSVIKRGTPYVNTMAYA